MKNIPILITQDLAEAITETAKHFGLSREDLLEQALGLFIDWRAANLTMPDTEEQKSAAITRFADKLFGNNSRHSCF